MRNYLILSSVSLTIFTLFTNGSCHKDLPYTQLGNWTSAAPIGNYPRGNASTFTIDDKAFVGLGYNEHIGGMGRLNDFWSFTVDSGWTQVQDFPGAPRSNAAAFSLNGYGYVGTGTDGINAYTDFYQYDPLANQWNQKPDYPGGARYDAVGFGLQNLGYLGTGFNVVWKNDFYQFDPVKNSWAKTIGTSGNFSKRQGASAFLYKNKAYIVGGSVSGGMASDFWSFDPSQSQPWTRLNDIINTDHGSFDDGYSDITRMYATVFVNGDKAYMTTGINTSILNSTWCYDFASDLWSPRTPWPRTPRSGAVSFTVSGKSFVGAGTTGSQTLDDFSRFIPDQPYNGYN